jgi:hypothetical protein
MRAISLLDREKHFSHTFCSAFCTLHFKSGSLACTVACNSGDYLYKKSRSVKLLLLIPMPRAIIMDVFRATMALVPTSTSP